MVVLFVIASCRKKAIVPPETFYTGPLTKGIPGDCKKLNGYLTAVHTRTSNLNFEFYCAFSDPGRSLAKSFDVLTGISFDTSYTGIVTVGTLHINDIAIAPQKINRTVRYYDSRALGSIPGNILWSVPGNRSLPPLNTGIQSPFPVFINFNGHSWQLKTSQPFTVYPDSIFTNYDSVMVCVNDCMNFNYTLRKGGKRQAPVVFTADEIKALQIYNSGCFLFTIIAFNHYHQVINNKLYLFEFVTKTINWGNVVP
jgi:hypothetical protein